MNTANNDTIIAIGITIPVKSDVEKWKDYTVAFKKKLGDKKIRIYNNGIVPVLRALQSYSTAKGNWQKLSAMLAINKLLFGDRGCFMGDPSTIDNTSDIFTALYCSYLEIDIELTHDNPTHDNPAKIVLEKNIMRQEKRVVQFSQKLDETGIEIRYFPIHLDRQKRKVLWPADILRMMQFYKQCMETEDAMLQYTITKEINKLLNYLTFPKKIQYPIDTLIEIIDQIEVAIDNPEMETELEGSNQNCIVS